MEPGSKEPARPKLAAGAQKMTARRQSFTLIEMLVVILLIVLLAALVIPATNGIARSEALANAQQMVEGQINLARQTAISGALPVEVRFYSYPDTTGSTDFHALQIWRWQAAGAALPLGNVIKLPGSIIMLDNGTGSNLSGGRSTLLDTTLQRTSTPSDPQLPGFSGTYQIASFIYSPDGSTNLAVGGGWHLTLANKQPAPPAAPGVPPDFATIQLDPLLGTTRSYRPGL